MLLPHVVGRLVHDTVGAAIPDKLHTSDRVPRLAGGTGLWKRNYGFSIRKVFSWVFQSTTTSVLIIASG
jgi:hypothetical protein